MEAKDTSMLLRKLGLKSKGLDANAADETLEEERQTYTRDGEKKPGFTSSVTQTMEEKQITESASQQKGQSFPEDQEQREETQENGDATPVPSKAQNGDAAHAQGSQETEEARAGDELYGVPAHGDPQHDGKVPNPPGDADEEEQKAPAARSAMRKSMNGSSKAPQSKTYTLPTPTPHVDPRGFEDPISDEFWRKVWLACAVHNVSICHTSIIGSCRRY